MKFKLTLTALALALITACTPTTPQEHAVSPPDSTCEDRVADITDDPQYSVPMTAECNAARAHCADNQALLGTYWEDGSHECIPLETVCAGHGAVYVTMASDGRYTCTHGPDLEFVLCVPGMACEDYPYYSEN